MKLETILFGHITLLMLIAFILGAICLLLFTLKEATKTQKGYSVKRFLKPTPLNIAYHLVASFALFLGLQEVGEIIISKIGLDTSKTYDYLLSFGTGAFGSIVVSYVFEKVRKIQNKLDPNIKHVHNDNCEHN